jgi:hypothetical protein
MALGWALPWVRFHNRPAWKAMAATHTTALNHVKQEDREVTKVSFAWRVIELPPYIESTRQYSVLFRYSVAITTCPAQSGLCIAPAGNSR